MVNLAFSARYITEQVLRFPMDYIDSDTYYRSNTPDTLISHAPIELLRSTWRVSTACVRSYGGVAKYR